MRKIHWQQDFKFHSQEDITFVQLVLHIFTTLPQIYFSILNAEEDIGTCSYWPDVTKSICRISLAVQWLRFCSMQGDEGLIPGQGNKIPHALQPKNQDIKQKQYCNRVNKDFKNGQHQNNS